MANYFETEEYKASEEYLKEQQRQDNLYNDEGDIYESAINESFIAGVNWQKNRNLIAVSEDLKVAADEYASRVSLAYKGVYCEYANDQIAFKAGAKWQKEQIMKNAVEGTICFGSKGAYVESDWLNTHFVEDYGNSGCKIKLIIIKEE